MYIQYIYICTYNNQQSTAGIAWTLELLEFYIELDVDSNGSLNYIHIICNVYMYIHTSIIIIAVFFSSFIIISHAKQQQKFIYKHVDCKELNIGKNGSNGKLFQMSLGYTYVCTCTCFLSTPVNEIISFQQCREKSWYDENCRIAVKGEKNCLSRTDCANFRRIRLHQIAYKVLSVLNERLNHIWSRSCRSPIDQLFTVREIFEKTLEKIINTHQLFVDYKVG